MRLVYGNFRLLTSSRFLILHITTCFLDAVIDVKGCCKSKSHNVATLISSNEPKLPILFHHGVANRQKVVKHIFEMLAVKTNPSPKRCFNRARLERSALTLAGPPNTYYW